MGLLSTQNLLQLPKNVFENYVLQLDWYKTKVLSIKKNVFIVSQNLSGTSPYYCTLLEHYTSILYIKMAYNYDMKNGKLLTEVVSKA